MRILVVGFTALLLAGCTHTEKYDNGSIKARGPINWLSGKQEGSWLHYHPNGEIRSRGEYLEDLQIGEWTYFYTNGTPEMTGAYADHRRAGTWQYFHRGQSDPGPLSGEGGFHRGYQDGVWTFWDRKGNRIQEGGFDRGKQSLRWRYFYPGGEPKAEGYYFDGAKVGVWKFWNREGKLAEKDYRMPKGVELVVEPWPGEPPEGGGVRRIGFQRDDQKVGRWEAYHPNGERRFVGNFRDGVPDGSWTIYDLEGQPLTSGPVTAGRPTGMWQMYGDDAFPWEPSVDRPGAAPFTGEWLTAEDMELLDPQNLVEGYLAEVSSSIGFDDVADIARTTDAEADDALVSGATASQRVPTPDVAWTKGDRDAMKVLPKLYGDSPPIVADSRYGLAPTRTGNQSKSRPLVGNPLPLTEFERADGGTLDLAEFQGKKSVLLIILRGFAQRVCVYCFEQMIAYKRSKLLDQWKDSVEILVVYPGPREGLDEFRRKFAKEPDRVIPDFPVLYDPNLALTEALGIVGEQAIPTTMILDRQGVVQWAYVGESIEDRPSAKLVDEKLEKHAK